MNGVKMSDCRFYVNEDERIVVCVIPNTADMVTDFIDEHFRFNDFNLFYGLATRLFRSLEMPYSFSGKAVCAPEDKWDVETGKLIAFSKAKNKCYKSFFKRANKFIQIVDKRMNDAMDLFNAFGMKLSDKRESLEKEIKERVE